MMFRIGLAILLCSLLALAVVGVPNDPGMPLPPLHAALAKRQMTVFEPRPPAPQTVFQDGAGRELTLAAFEGQVVLLVFWATWCPYCRRELPELDRLQAALGTEGLKVVALSVDRDGVAAVAPYMARNRLQNLPIYVAPGRLIRADFGYRGVPSSVLIDRRGRVIAAKSARTEWERGDGIEFLRHYLREAG